MAMASLLVPGVSIPQPDSSWLSNLGGTLGDIGQNIRADRSFNAFADRIGGAAPAQAPAAGFLPRLTGGGQQAAAAPMTAPVGPVSRGPSQGSTYAPFIETVKQKITNPYGLAAVAATGRSESGWSGDKANATWADPSQSGQPGTSGGILSWRGPRLANLQSYAASKGEQGNGSPATQAEFFVQEDPTLINRLNAAQSPEEAADIMAGAWAFAGHDNPNTGEAARRRALTTNYYAQEFRDGQGAPAPAPAEAQPASAPARVASNVVASLDPSSGIPMPGWAGPMRANDPSQAVQPAPQVAAAAPQPQAQPAPAAPMQTAQQGVPSGLIAAGVTPVARGTVDPSLIQDMLRDRNLRQVGLQLWAANVQGQKGSEPWQFVNLPDGTLARANQQTGAVERLGNFAKPNEDATVVGDNLVKRSTGEVIYEGKPKTPASFQEFQLAQQNGFQGTYADWEKVKVPGATSLTVNNGETDKFYENLDKKNAETFSAMSDSGIQARSKLGQIDRLDSLLSGTPQGYEGAIKQWLGDIGVKTEGLDNLQATRAIIEKMVPEQRAPGSGTMSDGDIAMFRNSLPRVINQPGGNALIMQTLRGITDYQMKQGEIADQVADRTIKPAEGRKRLRELPNPLSDYRESVKGFNTAPASDGSGVQRAVNPTTGEVLELRNGEWVKAK